MTQAKSENSYDVARSAMFHHVPPKWALLATSVS